MKNEVDGKRLPCQQFNNQGGAATSDPNVIMRWLSSTVLNRLFTAKRMRAKRVKAESRRKKSGEPIASNIFISWKMATANWRHSC